MRDDRDYKVELSNQGAAAEDERSCASSSSRPYVSVHFTCCNVYLRIYRSADGTAYRGSCPRCGRPVQLKVGVGGTDARFFRVE